MKRVVISGATGAIGMALIQKCVEDAIEVIVLVRPESPRNAYISRNANITIIECGLEEMHTFRNKKEMESIRKCDVFYHFAWAGTFGDFRNSMEIQAKNIEYTLDAVELAHRLGCHTFIGAGSQAEYGRVEGKLSSTTPTNPENGYGIAKLCAGQMSRIRCHQLGMKHIWTRILSVYGPYDGSNTMVMSTIDKLLKGITPSFTKAEQQWDYLYSGDAARVMVLLGDKGSDGQIYCIGSGRTKPLSEYIKIIQDIVSPDMTMGFGEIPYSPQQVMYLCADIGELKRDTGFEPQVMFEDGIRNTVEWIKNRTK